MEILSLIILIIFCILGVAGLFFNFLGTFWIAAGAAVFAVLTSFNSIRPFDLVLIGLLYITGEIMDWIAIAIGARKFGASKAAVWGSLLGGFAGGGIGAMFFGIGLLPGLLAGVFLGAFIFELMSQGDFKRALKAGIGSGVGFFFSWGLKFILALAMLGWIIYRIFWP